MKLISIREVSHCLEKALKVILIGSSSCTIYQKVIISSQTHSIRKMYDVTVCDILIFGFLDFSPNTII